MIGLNTLVRIIVSSILTAMVSTAPDTVTTISLVNVLTQPNDFVSAMMVADNTEDISDNGVSMASIDMVTAIMQMDHADTEVEEVIVEAKAETPVELMASVEIAAPVEIAAAETYAPAETSVETQITEFFTETAAETAAETEDDWYAETEDDWYEVTEDWQDVDVIAAVSSMEITAPVFEEAVSEPVFVEVEVQRADEAAADENVWPETDSEAPETVWSEVPQEVTETQTTIDQIPEEAYTASENWDEVEEWTASPETTTSTATVESAWSGDVLTASAGVVTGPNGRETYYNLDMSGVVGIMESMGYDYEYWVRDDGVKMYGDYVMVAANLDTHPRGSIYETSLGYGIVVDTGSFAYDDPNQTDIAVNW